MADPPQVRGMYNDTLPPLPSYSRRINSLLEMQLLLLDMLLFIRDVLLCLSLSRCDMLFYASKPSDMFSRRTIQDSLIISIYSRIVRSLDLCDRLGFTLLVVNDRFRIVLSDDAPGLLLDLSRSSPWCIDVLFRKVFELRNKGSDEITLLVALLPESDGRIHACVLVEEGRAAKPHPVGACYHIASAIVPLCEG